MIDPSMVLAMRWEYSVEEDNGEVQGTGCCFMVECVEEVAVFCALLFIESKVFRRIHSLSDAA